MKDKTAPVHGHHFMLTLVSLITAAIKKVNIQLERFINLLLFYMAAKLAVCYIK
jgi:hypothetical protein